MDPAVNILLKQGIAAARAGKRAEARALLKRVVEADERSEQGWLWLAGVLDDPADMRACLAKVLALNPGNAAAKKGLAWIEQRYGPEPAAPLLERAVGEPGEPARPERNPVTTTTVSLARDEFEQAAARHPAAPTLLSPTPPAPARQPTTRLREAVFDPLSTPLASSSPPTRRENPARPAAAPTMLMARVADPPAPAPAAPVVAQAAPPAKASAPARPAPAPAPAEALPSAPPANPCPYCGSPTMLKQQRCTQCRHSLMVRATPPARRSLALTALGAIWLLGGVLMLVAAALLGVLLLLQRGAPAAAAAVPGGFLAIVLAAVLLFGLLCIGVARGLWARVREFYFLSIALIVVGVVVRVGLLLRGAALVAGLAALAGQATPWPGAIGTAVAVLPLIMDVVLVLLPLVLTALSYRDFFGPLTRFAPAVEKAEHADHYNRGLGYRDRGMWYMATQEWFTAARLRPHERTYLQALGLAYAQIKQLYPNAKASLGDVEAFLRGRKAELYAAAPELERLKLL